MKIREEHDEAWRSPERERGNFPNEEFFVRKTQGRLAPHNDDDVDDDYGRVCDDDEGEDEGEDNDDQDDWQGTERGGGRVPTGRGSGCFSDDDQLFLKRHSTLSHSVINFFSDDNKLFLKRHSTFSHTRINFFSDGNQIFIRWPIQYPFSAFPLFVVFVKKC